MMNDDQLLRYARQIMLPEIDIAGQEKLLASRVLVVGLGGLGSPVAMYLAAAGVGQLILADFDEVEISNLQRQVAHTTDRLGMPKVESAAMALKALNPDVELELINARMDDARLHEVVGSVDLVVDCTDRFAIRFAVNRACLAHRKPLVSGAAVRLEGQVLVVDPRVPDSACYQCLYQGGDDSALNCAETGVAAPVVGIIGTIQAMEVIKVLVGLGEALTGQLLVFDAMHMDFRRLKLPRDPDCGACGQL